MKYRIDMIESDWFAYTKPVPEAALRLFCLPHAGGGASSYREWVTGLAPEIEVIPVQFPGRETRFMERPFDNITPLLEALLVAIRPYLDKPFAFFGHSLGALIGYELAKLLGGAGFVPQHLFVSGYGAPHLPVQLPPMCHLEDSAFVDALRELNTVPTAVLENDELIDLLLPMLRADFAVYEQYQYREAAPVSCPITMLGGDADPLVSPEMLAAWATYSAQLSELYLFPGDHFYLQEQETAVWRAIRRSCLVAQSS